MDKSNEEEKKVNVVSPKNILLVEDDVVLRNMYEQRLRMDGYNVLSSSNGEEGYEIFQNNKIDLLITDIMLPRLSGTELIEKIRKNIKGRNLKIIAWSNLADDEEKSKVLNLGVLEYLIKNEISLDKLSETVKKYIS